MGQLVQKSKRFILRSLLVIAVICLILVVVIQVGLLVAINALNSGKAHHYIQAQLTSAMASSGYNATFDKITYDPIRGFTVYNLVVLDKSGAFATADKFSLDIAFSKIPFKRLDLVANAGAISFLRLPSSQTEEKTAPENIALQPFSMPNIYFRTIQISHLNVDKLNISAAVAGQDLSFSPRLKATVKFSDQLSVDASLLPKPDTTIGGITLPEKIELAGMFYPSTLSFAVTNFLVVSPDYHVGGKGDGQLTQDGKININLDASYPDMKKITQGDIQSANLSLVASGVYQHPVVHMNGTVIPAALKEKGLADIIVTATTNDISDDLKGNISITTSYLKEPISLESALAYKGDTLTLESLKGTAPQIMLDGAGTVSVRDSLWNGKLSVTSTDLSYYKDLLSTDIAGALKIDAVFKPINKVQAVDVIASATQTQFGATKLGKADVGLHFADIAHLWPQSANVRISNLSLSDTVSFDRAQAIIKDMGNEVYSLSVDGNGNVPSAVSFKGGMSVSDMTNNLPTFRNIDFKTIFGKSSISLAGALDQNVTDLRINTQNFRGSDIPAELPEALKNMRLNGDIAMSGTPAMPSTKARVVGAGIDTGKYKNLVITLDANHQDGKTMMNLSGKGSGIKALQANAVFPVTFSLFPFVFNVDMKAPLSGNILADIDLGAIPPLFLLPTQKFSAALKSNADLGGTLSEPDVKGSLKIQNGQFADEQNGIHLSSLNINSSFTKNSLIVESLSATDGEKGKMNGRGHVDFANSGNTDFSLSLQKFHLPSSHLADGMMDATFSLSNVNAGYALKGTVDINHINIIVPETFQSKIPELNIVERQKKSASVPQAKAISLAIKVNAPNQIFVRGWGLDAEFGGQLSVSGDVTAPLFDGNLSSKRGRYEEFGKRFTLARANLRFQGELPPSPYLDIEATTQADDVTASILLTGPVMQPSIAFSSTPVLPQDEVLSRILFGRNTAKITPFQAIQLAQTLRRFSGEGGDGGINPLDMLRSTTGLDDISINTDANGETNVGVGKYLTDKVYLEFEKGKAANSGGANIQIEVTPSINIQSEVGQDAQAGGGVFWKRDY